MFRVIFLGFLVFTTFCVVAPTSVYAISLDDEEEDAEDVADILEQAQKAGKSEAFGKADALLKEAKMYGVKTEKTQETEKLIAKKKAAKAERERKERERLARIKREKEQRARQARLAAQRRNTYSSTARSLDYVMVNFESVCGFSGCIDKNLQISGGPGRFSPSYSGATSGAIHKGYNGGLAGQYLWSAQFSNNFCSGTFYLSGKKRNVSLSIHPDCYGFNVHEY